MEKLTIEDVMEAHHELWEKNISLEEEMKIFKTFMYELLLSRESMEEKIRKFTFVCNYVEEKRREEDDSKL